MWTATNCQVRNVVPNQEIPTVAAWSRPIAYQSKLNFSWGSVWGEGWRGFSQLRVFKVLCPSQGTPHLGKAVQISASTDGNHEQWRKTNCSQFSRTQRLAATPHPCSRAYTGFLQWGICFLFHWQMLPGSWGIFHKFQEEVVSTPSALGGKWTSL